MPSVNVELQAFFSCDIKKHMYLVQICSFCRTRLEPISMGFNVALI